MPRDASLSDSKSWNGGHEWVNIVLGLENTSSSPNISVFPDYDGYTYSFVLDQICHQIILDLYAAFYRTFYKIF